VKARFEPYWCPKRVMPAKLVRPINMNRAALPRMADSGCRWPCRLAGVGNGGQLVEEGRGTHTGASKEVPTRYQPPPNTKSSNGMALGSSRDKADKAW
jgi:hypothetical protein